MVGEHAIQTMKANWLQYVPALLRLEDSDDEVGESASHKALKILDKWLRSTGVGAKSPAVFAEYDVSVALLDNSSSYRIMLAKTLVRVSYPLFLPSMTCQSKGSNIL